MVGTASGILTVLLIQWFVVLFVSGESKLSKLNKETRNVFVTPLEEVPSDGIYFEVVEPDRLRFTYKVKPARNFGAEFNHTYALIDLYVAEPYHGCSPLSNADAVEGSGVLIVRGDCSFLSKAIIAQEAGAVFAIITDNNISNHENTVDMVHDDTTRRTNIPVAFLSGKDGHMIMSTLRTLGVNNAVVNLPVNMTTVPVHKRNRPPWTLW